MGKKIFFGLLVGVETHAYSLCWIIIQRMHNGGGCVWEKVVFLGSR
jgi:hypothetical protein